VFQTDGRWTARDLERFAGAVRQLYDTCLAARIAATSALPVESYAELKAKPTRFAFGPDPPFGYGSREATMDRQLRFVVENLDRLAPEQQLTVASITMASPGGLGLRGSGEIVHGLGDVATKIYTRKEIKEALTLENEAKQIDIDRSRIELEKERATAGLEVAVHRFKLIREMFVGMYGEAMLDTEAGQEQFRQFLASASTLEELASGGKLSLPPTVEDD
jgi:hypothetical protein